MADVSKITTIDGTTYNFKDSTSRELINGKADKNNPVFTGNITLGNTTMTETQLIAMLDILAELQPAAGVSF